MWEKREDGRDRGWSTMKVGVSNLSLARFNTLELDGSGDEVAFESSEALISI